MKLLLKVNVIHFTGAKEALFAIKVMDSYCVAGRWSAPLPRGALRGQFQQVGARAQQGLCPTDPRDLLVLQVSGDL